MSRWNGAAARLRSLTNPPRYGPLGMYDPQPYISVWLEGMGEAREVTRNNVVTALRPFTIGIMFDSRTPLPGGEDLRLCLRHRASNRPPAASPEGQLLGVIRLRFARNIQLAEHHFGLFEITGCENRCVSRPAIGLYYLRKWYSNRLKQRRNPYNFQMTPLDLRASYVFYICPRPVVLVTVIHGDRGNMFPMDLIGPTDSPWFSMALRKTSPAVALMEGSRRLALAKAPLAYKQYAYEMGKHHKLAAIDWAGLPFAVDRSPAFGLPVAAAAPAVREVEIRECHEVGSHRLFVTSIVEESRPKDSSPETPQLFHAFSSYRQYLAMNREDGRE